MQAVIIVPGKGNKHERRKTSGKGGEGQEAELVSSLTFALSSWFFWEN